MNSGNQSEIAQLREKIAREYQAARRVSIDFTSTARHEFIIQRQKNIAACFEQLKEYMDPKDAMELIIQVGDQVQGNTFLPGVQDASRS